MTLCRILVLHAAELVLLVFDDSSWILTASITLIGIVQAAISRNPHDGWRVRTVVRPAINNNWSGSRAREGRPAFARNRISRDAEQLSAIDQCLMN